MTRGRLKKIIDNTIIKKKRGRPRKIIDNNIPNKPISEKPITGKKRGRPKKITNNIIPDNEIPSKRIIRKRKPRKNKITSIPASFRIPADELSSDELEERREEMRAFTPKLNRDKPRNIVDLSKDPKECKNITAFSCFRPDVYLDYGCWNCSLYKNCACPIKMSSGSLPKKRRK